MKIKLGLVVFCFIVLSCANKKNIQTTYYKSGEVLSEIEYNVKEQRNGDAKEFFKNGIISKIAKYSNGELIDTTYTFYSNGNKKDIIIFLKDSIYTKGFYENGAIKGKGKLLKGVNTKKIGWWEFFKENGQLDKKVEFVNILNEEYVNQSITYLSNSIIDTTRSYFYTIKTPDTVQLKSKHKVNIGYSSPKSKDSNVYLVVAKDLKEDFSNLNQIKKDSMLLPFGILDFDMNFKEQGVKNIRGYFYEKYLDSLRPNKNSLDSLDASIFERKIYFDKKIFVLDSVN